MCMGSSMPTYQPPKARVVEPGDASPAAKVNDQVVENANDRSLQDTKRNSNRGATATAQSSKTDKAY